MGVLTAQQRNITTSYAERCNVGPFTYDVYIGYARADHARVVKLRQKLEQRGLSCFTQYDERYDNEAVIIAAMKKAVASSKGVVIYLSPDYLKDIWFKEESQAVLENVNFYNKNALFLLKDSRLQQNPTQFWEHRGIDVDDSTFPDESLVQRIADACPKGKYSVEK